MPVASSRAIALLGMRGELVRIEADITATIPGIVIIGLPDASLAEARERVRSAAANSGLPLPPRRLTINLSPAALPKHGSAFDLGIALAVLAAAELVPAAAVERTVHVGELGLDGSVRAVPGVLPAVLAAREAGVERIMVPSASLAEARLVDGIAVLGASSLRDAALQHGADLAAESVRAPIGGEPVHRTDENDTGGGRAPSPAPADARRGASALRDRDDDGGDLADVVGNDEAVEALVVAAAGGHHLLLMGPPGAGKTMLAARMPGILPDLGVDAAIEVASVRSLDGARVAALPRRPPFEAPHHTASAVALVGGGSGVIRPGALSRAAHGVLFLDEAPEMSAHALDALRQPLESGRITIHRAGAVATFPANAQIVLAANPCPCGRADDRGVSECRCPPMTRRRYLQRLSGPLLDRIDLQIRVRRVSSAHLLTLDRRPRPSTAAAADRVSRARRAAVARLSGTPWRANAQLPSRWLRGEDGGVRLPRSATAELDRAVDRASLSMRARDRLLRVGWTIADLAGASSPTADHLATALALRSAMA